MDSDSPVTAAISANCVAFRVNSHHSTSPHQISWKLDTHGVEFEFIIMDSGVSFNGVVISAKKSHINSLKARLFVCGRRAEGQETKRSPSSLELGDAEGEKSPVRLLI